MWPALASFPWSFSPKEFLGWLKKKVLVQNYTPTDHPVTTYKQAVVLMAKSARHGDQIDGPVFLWLTFVMPRTQAITWKARPMPRRWHDKKPDCDNLTKAVKDAITTAGIWGDDSQVVWMNVQKIIASGDEQPRTIIRIAAAADVSGIPSFST
jgi:Holliday junction resolvase RusA-like endonuclease